jgi:hypothetical protein
VGRWGVRQSGRFGYGPLHLSHSHERIPHGFHGAEIDRSRTIGTVNEDGDGTVGEMPMECYSGLSIRESSTFTYPAMELKEGGGDAAPYLFVF